MLTDELDDDDDPGQQSTGFGTQYSMSSPTASAGTWISVYSTHQPIIGCVFPGFATVPPQPGVPAQQT